MAGLAHDVNQAMIWHELAAMTSQRWKKMAEDLENFICHLYKQEFNSTGKLASDESEHVTMTRHTWE